VSETIQNLAEEDRAFRPPPGSLSGQHKRSWHINAKAKQDPAAFGGLGQGAGLVQDVGQGSSEWNLPDATMVLGGKLNACYNCVIATSKWTAPNKVAIIFEGEPGGCFAEHVPGASRRSQPNRDALIGFGCPQGRSSLRLLPMIAELSITMLACARIGAAHSVVFGGFSSDSL